MTAISTSTVSICDVTNQNHFSSDLFDHPSYVKPASKNATVLAAIIGDKVVGLASCTHNIRLKHCLELSNR